MFNKLSLAGIRPSPESRRQDGRGGVKGGSEMDWAGIGTENDIRQQSSQK